MVVLSDKQKFFLLDLGKDVNCSGRRSGRFMRLMYGRNYTSVIRPLIDWGYVHCDRLCVIGVKSFTYTLSDKGVDVLKTISLPDFQYWERRKQRAGTLLIKKVIEKHKPKTDSERVNVLLKTVDNSVVVISRKECRRLKAKRSKAERIDLSPMLMTLTQEWILSSYKQNLKELTKPHNKEKINKLYSFIFSLLPNEMKPHYEKEFNILTGNKGSIEHLTIDQNGRIYGCWDGFSRLTRTALLSLIDHVQVDLSQSHPNLLRLELNEVLKGKLSEDDDRQIDNFSSLVKESMLYETLMEVTGCNDRHQIKMATNAYFGFETTLLNELKGDDKELTGKTNTELVTIIGRWMENNFPAISSFIEHGNELGEWKRKPKTGQMLNNLMQKESTIVMDIIEKLRTKYKIPAVRIHDAICVDRQWADKVVLLFKEKDLIASYNEPRWPSKKKIRNHFEWIIQQKGL
jgi:hypothetical protein